MILKEWIMTKEEIMNLSFEDALGHLDMLVRELEAGKIKLDDAVSAYEQASELKKLCESKLQDAQLKIEKITSLSGEDFVVEEFEKIENDK